MCNYVGNARVVVMCMFTKICSGKTGLLPPLSKQKWRVSRRVLGLGKIDQETRMEQISARLPFFAN